MRGARWSRRGTASSGDGCQRQSRRPAVHSAGWALGIACTGIPWCCYAMQPRRAGQDCARHAKAEEALPRASANGASEKPRVPQRDSGTRSGQRARNGGGIETRSNSRTWHMVISFSRNVCTPVQFALPLLASRARARRGRPVPRAWPSAPASWPLRPPLPSRAALPPPAARPVPPSPASA